MKNRINNILIGLLWLLAVALGATFWFNTKYGFNIFSFPHWQYLAYMQASHQPIRTSFYISFLIVVIIAVFGLYKLLQPRRRRIVLPIIDKTPQTTEPEQMVSPEPINNDKPTEQQSESLATPTPVRPPRLNIPSVPHTAAPVPYVPLSSTKSPYPTNPEQEYADIREVFTSAGFVYKGAPRIKNIQTSVIAIGTDEILWIGATGVSVPDMQLAVNTLKGVFSDTLEDIEINVNAFIIDAPDKTADDSVMLFKSVDDLRAFMAEHQNIPPSEDEIENFDAYSGYIGTVIEYLGKI